MVVRIWYEMQTPTGPVRGLLSGQVDSYPREAYTALVDLSALPAGKRAAEGNHAWEVGAYAWYGHLGTPLRWTQADRKAA